MLKMLSKTHSCSITFHSLPSICHSKCLAAVRRLGFVPSLVVLDGIMDVWDVKDCSVPAEHHAQ